MKTINTKLVENKTIEVFLTLDKAEWNTFLNKAKKDEIEKLEVKGFRKGKVPPEISKNLIKNETVRSIALNAVMEKYSINLQDAIYKYEVITQPEFSIIKLTDTEFEVKFIANLFPKIKLANLVNVKLKFKEPSLTQDELIEVDKNLNKLFSKKIEVTKGLIKKDDLVKLDFLGKIDGKVFEGGEAKDYELRIGSKSFIDTFEEQLIGKEIGTKQVIKVKFPEVYPSEALKGKVAEFFVNLKAIIKIIKMNEEEIKEKLRKENFSTLKAYKQHYINDLKTKKLLEAEEKYFDEYVDELLKLPETKLVLPKELVDQRVKQTIMGFKKQLAQQNMNFETYLEKLKIDLKTFVEKNVTPNIENELKKALVFSQLIKDLKIKVDDKEIESEYNKLAIENKLSKEVIKKEIPIDNLKNSLMFKKIVEKLKNI